MEILDHIAELRLLQPRQPSHRVEHADALKAVVDRAFRAELRVRAQERELEPEPGKRALEAGADLSDDLLEPMRLDLESGDEVGKKVDELRGIAVEGAAGDHERLEVVIALGE